MSPEQHLLLQHLMRAAAEDQRLSFSSTWSKSRLRTTLVHRCLADGHEVVDPPVAGTPLQVKQPTRASRAVRPDLQVLHRSGDKLLYVDLLIGATQVPHEVFTSEDAQAAATRLADGKIDAMIVSADAVVYEQVLAPARKSRRHALAAAVLPPAAWLSLRQPRRHTHGDITLETVGLETVAFGASRVMCVVSAMDY
jgi:hypothetical protein